VNVFWEIHRQKKELKKQVIEAHKGFVKVERQMGIASTFTFGLPLQYTKSLKIENKVKQLLRLPSEKK
jgi:hypothetical protein